MRKQAVVAGTGFANRNGTKRSEIIRQYIKESMPVVLVREPNNPHDTEAIAVYLKVPILFGILGHVKKQIGYIKATTADNLAKLMDNGVIVDAYVSSYYAPDSKTHPRVSLTLVYEST